ncbi:MAG: DNA-binding response regulator [Spirochaetaceae bacterium]|nr:MAG: DNA-binding response regulator [Spirochaetaceae bacterium]
MKQSVLIVEDDPDIVTVVRTYFEAAGFSVATAEDGSFGLSTALNASFSLIVLDWMLPGLDGPAFMKRLRVRCATPVIMLTAKAEEQDRLTGFSVGVDDYVVKPFSPKELVARAKAVLARTSDEPPGERVLRFDGLRIDPATRNARTAERVIDLTTREFDLLLLLARHPHRVFSRDELLERVWGGDYGGADRVVDVHVSNLRAKIEPHTRGQAFIQTVRGAGYRFAADEIDTGEADE